MAKKSKKIKINCVGGKPVSVTKTYAFNIRRQILQTIKTKRRENPNTSKFYFFGVAEFKVDENKDIILCITYGDALSALETDKTGKIYAEVPFRIKRSKKNTSVIL